MKSIQLIITSSTLVLLPSCSLVGLHSGKDLRNESRRAYTRGLNAGKAIAARAEYLRQQEELEKPQPQFKGYKIRVPQQQSPDGLNHYAHDTTVKIITK